MASKVFETLFRLKAKYEGKPAFNSLHQDLNKVEKRGVAAGRSMQRAFDAVKIGITALVSSRAFREVLDFGKWVMESAKEQQKAHDLVRVSNQRLADQGRISQKQVEQHTQEVIALGEAMNKAGGLDAETLEGGMAELSKAFTWKQIKGMSKGWQDWMVRLHKGAPTMEQAIEDADKLTEFVFRGKAKPLEDMGITKEQIEALNKLESAQERVVAIEKIIGKQTGETVAWKKTAAGAEYDAAVAAEDFGEKAGKSAAEALPEYNRALVELYGALEPISKLIDEQLGQNLKNLTNWIIENKDEIKTWSEFTKTSWDNLIAAQNKSQEFFKPYLDALEDHLKKSWEALKWLGKEAWELFTWLAGVVGANWENMAKSFDDTKAQWVAVVGWIGDKIIMPVYNWFVWLKDEILKIWDLILPIWLKMTGAAIPPGTQITPTIPGNMNWRYGGGDQGSIGSPGSGVVTGTATSNAGLEAARAAFIEEMKDPQKRARLYARTKGEVGGQGPDAIQKEMETIFNRSWARRQTIDQTARQGGKAGNYWGSQYKAVSEQEAKVYDLALSNIARGSDVSNLATGNESAGLRNGQVVSTGRGGERYVIEPNDVRRQRELQAIKARGSLNEAAKEMNQPKTNGGGTTTQNVNMSPVINVNGVAAGSEQLVANRVKTAVRDPLREGLKQMKDMRSYEYRKNMA